MSVVVFDGICTLCNSSVDFIIRRDRKDHFSFTANQHEHGRKILEDHGEKPDKVETLYLLEEGKLYKKSTAALRIARQLPAPWSWLYVFIIVPRPIRDAVYGLIAKNRYRLFGQKETCRIPTPAERAKFLV